MVYANMVMYITHTLASEWEVEAKRIGVEEIQIGMEDNKIGVENKMEMEIEMAACIEVNTKD